MEFRQIQYFIAIAELEHFGRASQKLSIAQPALSRQIKLLEAELEVELFERLPRGIRLTPAGRVLLGHMQGMSRQISKAIAETRATAAGLLGTLHLGVIEASAWQGLVPDGIARFRSQFPQVNLALSAMASGDQLTAIRQGRLDGGILYNAPDDPAFDVLRLERHPVMLAVHANSPLAQQERFSIHDLTDQPFIGFCRQVSPLYYDDTQAALRHAGVMPHFIAEMWTEADMLALVSAGAGIALVNSCQSWRPPHAVRFRPLVDFEVALELCFVNRRDDTSPVITHVREMLTELAAARALAATDAPAAGGALG